MKTFNRLFLKSSKGLKRVLRVISLVLFISSLIYKTALIGCIELKDKQQEKVYSDGTTTAFAGACSIQNNVTEPNIIENSVTIVAEQSPFSDEEAILNETEEVDLTTIVEWNVPNDEEACNSDVFTYMDYKKITCKSTAQYAIVNSELAYTDEETGLRMYNGEYLVAIAQGYGFTPGDEILIVFESGNSVCCYVGEMKATADCDANEKYQATDGSVVEFLVDDISSVEEFNSVKPEEFNEKVISITKVEG